MKQLSGKICLVTGGAKGLGRVFATALANEGARVVVADIVDGTELAKELGPSFITTDVSDPAQAAACVAQTMDIHGRIDVLVNNAALYASLETQSYRDIDPELFARVLSVNLTGAFNMIQAAGPVMEQQRHGKIINITSGTVYKGLPGMSHYIASKGGLMALTRALSRELGDSSITVNNLAPGLTLSDSIVAHPDHVNKAAAGVLASRAIKRHGLPEDLVGAMVFLASSGSDFMTGQTVVVDGGSVNT